MTLEKRLADRASEVGSALSELLSPSAMQEQGVPERLADAMRHAVMAGGKRLRPFLVIETAAMLGAEAAISMPAALAVELIHCYSLAHDDLPAMDNDRLRRGKPTVWVAYDEWSAILAGDGLLTMAFEVLADRRRGNLPDAVRLNLSAQLALASGGAGMVGGQCLDLQADKLGQPEVQTQAHILRLQAMKTGALFRFSCRAGAMVAGASADDVARLTRFGEKLGAAFQLADDLLDVEGDVATVGKATAKDAAAGKATLVGMLGLPGAHAALDALEREGAAELSPFGARADVLRETLHFACARKS